MKPTVGLVVAGLVIATASIVGFVALVHHDETAGPGGEIQWDDFGFGVVGVRTVREIGPQDGRIQARGEFCIVGLKVANHAQRVDYDLSNHEAVLFDGDGNAYHVDAVAGTALATESGAAAHAPSRIAAGESCVTQLVYDVPVGVHDLYLRILWGSGLINAIDIVVSGDRRITVPPGEMR